MNEEHRKLVVSESGGQERAAGSRIGERVTIREVAALAGVSASTVSNVLNHPHRVLPETVHRVEEAMTELGWIRNQIAQQLRGGGRSLAVGAVIGELAPNTVELLDVSRRALDGSGYVLQITSSNRQLEHESRQIDLFEQQGVRGMLLSPIQNHPSYLHRLRRLHVPVVVLGRGSTSGELCTVSTDDFSGGRIAVEYLRRLGHRQIAVVGGRSVNPHVQARRTGARAGARSGASLTIVSTDRYDEGAGLDAAHRIAAQEARDRPTAVFAINDRVAVGLQRGLQLAGLRIPLDISIIGYDDIPQAKTAPVALTTIHSPRDRIGAEAAALLLEEIAAADNQVTHVHRHLLLQPELIVRDSTDQLTTGG